MERVCREVDESGFYEPGGDIRENKYIHPTKMLQFCEIESIVHVVLQNNQTGEDRGPVFLHWN